MFIDRCGLRLILLLLSCFLIYRVLLAYVPCSFSVVLLSIRVMFFMLVHALVRVWFVAHVHSSVVEFSVCFVYAYRSQRVAFLSFYVACRLRLIVLSCQCFCSCSFAFFTCSLFCLFHVLVVSFRSFRWPLFLI